MYTDKKGHTVPIKVLLIEDDEDDFFIINELLTNIHDRDFDVTWISNPQDSLILLRKNQHDVCLLDYRLGAYNGIELLKKAQAFEVSMPVIFLTGQGEYTVDIEAMKTGATDYLDKDGLTSPLLERAIRYAVDRATAAAKLKKAYDELEDRVRQRTNELRHANEKLHKASEQINSFAYSVSHDLKSPSVALIGITRRFYENYSDTLGEKGKKYCEQIKKAAERIYSLVGMVNSFIAAKEMPLKLEDVRLEEILHDIKINYSEQLSERRIKWVMPEKAPIIRADRMCLFRILINLVENALKYGGKDLRTISIGIEENSREYIFSVKDDGKGLKKVNNLDIFQPFERVNASHEIEGSGLGLAIVKEMVEKHRGDVWYDSGFDKGAVFYISISKFI